MPLYPRALPKTIRRTHGGAMICHNSKNKKFKNLVEKTGLKKREKGKYHLHVIQKGDGYWAKRIYTEQAKIYFCKTQEANPGWQKLITRR
jgi:hypothetical protein